MATGSVTYNIPAAHTLQTLSGTIKTDGQFTVQPVANDQIVYPDALSCDAGLNISGPTGPYTLWHLIESTGVAHHISYVISGGGSVSYNAPAAHSYVTLAGTITVDQQFATQPVAGDQIVYPDALTVSATLSISGPAGQYTLWHVQTDGTATATVF